ncbi:unnamed protein product [Prunus armeniaca]|uniref:MBD domain-containing protein n=1 Tax=Prunus armeniaca TaxID=36596 RepID=A0A6J5U2P1_PRUAR|nr:unnamed protein product [Prunus armeniaca]
MSSSSNNNYTGQDQPVAAYPNSSALESSSAQINEKLHNQLVKSVKESVADFKLKLKAQSSEQPKPYTRRPTTPAGQSTAVRFKLPEAFDWDNLDVAKRERERERERREREREREKVSTVLVPPEANQNPNTQTERKFSFSQRLGGWSIVRTRRENGRNSDMCYRHEGAKWTFRSIREVVRYIMYEEDPAKKKGKEEEQGEDGSESKRSRKTNLNHYNDSGVKKSPPSNMEMGGPGHGMNNITTHDVPMIDDQELWANAPFTTDDGPTVADGQTIWDDLYLLLKCPPSP